jgi:hypothetical protein
MQIVRSKLAKMTILGDPHQESRSATGIVTSVTGWLAKAVRHAWDNVNMIAIKVSPINRSRNPNSIYPPKTHGRDSGFRGVSRDPGGPDACRRVFHRRNNCAHRAGLAGEECRRGGPAGRASQLYTATGPPRTRHRSGGRTRLCAGARAAELCEIWYEPEGVAESS